VTTKCIKLYEIVEVCYKILSAIAKRGQVGRSQPTHQDGGEAQLLAKSGKAAEEASRYVT